MKVYDVDKSVDCLKICKINSIRSTGLHKLTIRPTRVHDLHCHKSEMSAVGCSSFIQFVLTSWDSHGHHRLLLLHLKHS